MMHFERDIPGDVAKVSSYFFHRISFNKDRKNVVIHKIITIITHNSILKLGYVSFNLHRDE